MSTASKPAADQPTPPEDAIEGLLREARVIAVVGLSLNPMRPSNGVARYLQSVGYRVVPVNPGFSEILGERAYATLEAIPVAVDIVDVFRRPEHVPQIVESTIRIHARALWLQEGITHQAAEERAREAGLFVVSDRCILKEHSRRIRRQT